MNNDIEHVLQRLTPRGVGGDVRRRVLDAMQVELRSDAPSPWLRRCALATAAAIFVGIILNVWASKASERRLAQLFGPPPISRRAMEIAKDVEQLTNRQTGQWVYQQLTAGSANHDTPAVYAKYLATVNRLIKELETSPRDSNYETPKEDTEMDGHRSGVLVAIGLVANAWFVWTTDTRLERQLVAILRRRRPADPGRPGPLANSAGEERRHLSSPGGTRYQCL